MFLPKKIYRISDGDEQGNIWEIYLSGEEYDSVDAVYKALKDINSHNYDRNYKYFYVEELYLVNLRDGLESNGWI